MKIASLSLRIGVALFLATAANTLPAQADRPAIISQELPKLKSDYRAAHLTPLGRETSLSREYYRLLLRYVRYARTNMRDWPAEPGARFHKVDTSHELSVRQNATVALAFAVLSNCGDYAEKEAGGTSRAQVQSDATALLRYLAVTHAANFLPTGDGKPWGNHWQSAFWAGIAGQAAWLVWDRLPDETRVMIARMVIHEANRYNTRPPDDGEWSDTKAEENAWNSEVIALARCMFPDHPNAGLWHERAIVYMINSFTTQADRADDAIVDGKRIRDRVTTTCIHPDFTLENHGRVHPDYLSTFSLNLRNALLYKMAGRETPAATFHHVEDCCRVLQHLTAANGSLFYVNGQDWWPHRHDVPLMVGGLVGALLPKSPVAANAAFIEGTTLDWLKRMHSRFEDGRVFDKREYNYTNAEEEMMARYAELYLLHRLFGDHPRPAKRDAFLRSQSGARVFEIGGFVTHRTPEKFASFAWVNGAMGLVYPSDDTWFTAPHDRSLTGRITVDGAKDTPPKLEAKSVTLLRLVREQAADESGNRSRGMDRESRVFPLTRPADTLSPSDGERAGVRGAFGNDSLADGFSFVGRFARCGGKVEQCVAMISLPDEPVLYIERLRARTDVNVREVATGTLAILNEDARPLVPNQRRVWTSVGEQVMRGAAEAPARQHVWETTWANLDDQFGVVALASGKMAYAENHAYARARLQQELAANYLAEPGARKAGETISRAVIALFPNARHSSHGELHSEWSGENACVARLGGSLVAVNWGAAPARVMAWGVDFTLPPMTAEVRLTHRSQSVR